MTKTMTLLAAFALVVLAASEARAECQAQRAHDLGCTVECVRGKSCSNSECYSLVSNCDAYFRTQDNTRCGAFCQRNKGGTYRSYSQCLQQCNSGPMPTKQGSAARPTAPRPSSKPAAQQAQRPAASAQKNRPKAPASAQKNRPSAPAHHAAGDE
jgi:hypothetical protein